jgi:hypothetical protein
VRERGAVASTLSTLNEPMPLKRGGGIVV